MIFLIIFAMRLTNFRKADWLTIISNIKNLHHETETQNRLVVVEPDNAIGSHHGYFTIKITNSPYNVSKMPVIDDIIEVWEYPSNMDFEVQQELSFKIISAERLLLILTNFDDVKWKCNILILNQD